MFWECKVVSDIRKGEWVSKKSKLVLNHKPHPVNKELLIEVLSGTLQFSKDVEKCHLAFPCRIKRAQYYSTCQLIKCFSPQAQLSSFGLLVRLI